MSQKVLNQLECIDSSIEEIGIKCYRLAQITGDMNTPRFWVIPVSTCNEILGHGNSHVFCKLAKKTLKDTNTRNMLHHMIQETIEKVDLSQFLGSSLAGMLNENSPLLLRISLSEPAYHSNFRIISNISKLHSLEQAIKHILANEVKLRGLPFRGAIMIQKQVSASSEAFIYSANPNTGNRKEAIIQWQSCSQKLNLIHCWESQELQLLNDPMDNQKQKLDDSKNKLISSMLAHVHAVCRKFQHPLRIHYFIDDDGYHLISIKKPLYFPAIHEFNHLENIWSCESLDSSFLGITTPLSFSISRATYSSAIEELLRFLGIEKSTLSTFGPKLLHLLSYIKGQMFLNTSVVHAIATFLPSENQKEKFCDFLLSGSTKLSLYPKGFKWQRRIKSPLLHPQSIFLSSKQSIALNLVSKVQNQTKNNIYRNNMDELFRKFDHFFHYLKLTQQEILKNNIDKNEQIEILDNLLQKHRVPWQRHTLEYSICLPVPDYFEAFWLLATTFQEHKVFTRLDSSRPEKFFYMLKQDFPSVAGELEQFIDRFGFLSLFDNKSEFDNISAKPKFLLPILANYGNQLSIIKERLRIAEHQRTPSYFLREIGTGIHNPLAQEVRNIYKKISAITATGEKLKLARAAFFSSQKSLLTQMGHQLSNCHYLESPDDIHFLLVEELEAIELGGYIDATEIKSLIKRRRNSYLQNQKEALLFSQYRGRNPPAKFDDITTNLKSDSVTPWGQIKGHGLTDTNANGAIRKVACYNDIYACLLNRNILYLAQDSYFLSLLLPLVKGIIVEQSRQANQFTSLARIFLVPAALNVPQAGRLLGDGEMVHIEGHQGTIESYEKDSHAV